MLFVFCLLFYFCCESERNSKKALILYSQKKKERGKKKFYFRLSPIVQLFTIFGKKKLICFHFGPISFGNESLKWILVIFKHKTIFKFNFIYVAKRLGLNLIKFLLKVIFCLELWFCTYMLSNKCNFKVLATTTT